MLKRILSGFLTLVLVVTALPLTSFATLETEVAFGDVNSDGTLDQEDLRIMKEYIAEEDPDDFNFINADVNEDGEVDLVDLLRLQKYLADWDIALGGDDYVVRFFDGDRLIASYTVDRDDPVLGRTPSVEQTSKSDGIFVAWYTDPECTIPFYSEVPITESIDVYAKYEAVTGIEEVLTVDSFSKTDVSPDYTVFIRGEGDPSEAVTLVAKDGTETPALVVTPTGEDGIYSVTAEGGFRPGSPYELTLADGFNFVGETDVLPETIRRTTFTVYKEIVDNMKLNEDIVYIADTPEITYIGVDGNGDGAYDDTVDELSSDIGLPSHGATASVAGAGEMGLVEGDVVCFYVGTDPLFRVYTGPDARVYMGEPEVYVKVLSVSEDEIVFAPLGEDNLTSLYDIPDVFPIKAEVVNNTVNIADLDLAVYVQYGIDTPTLDYAKDRIAVGDFVAVYTVAKEGSIDFGKITDYDSTTGVIAFTPCTAEDITASRNMYIKPAVSGDDLVTEEVKQEIESIMREQIEESGFAEEAAYALANMTTQTESFRNMENFRSVLFADESGAPLTYAEVQSLNLGASFELSDDVTLSVEFITSGDELHFDEGVQLAVGLEAKFEVEAEEGTVVIELEATFIEELAITPTVDGSLTYFYLLGIPVPNGVHVTANVDVLNYTAYDFDVTVYTVQPEDENIFITFLNSMKSPSSVLDAVADAGFMPDSVASFLEFDVETAKDLYKAIDMYTEKIIDFELEQAAADEGLLEECKAGLEELWDLIDELNAKGVEGVDFNRATYAEAAKKFSRTKIGQELFHLSEAGITDGDAGVDNDVTIKSVEQLMERYSQMVQKSTDWVTLLDQKIAEPTISLKCVNIMLRVDFVIRANMSIAIGSTLEYESGQRYSFWFKMGLYKPTGGSSTMDILDESLVFQFYVMGMLHLKLGAQLTLGANIGSSDFAYVGIRGELGPYVKLYGFFIYAYEHQRAANTLKPVKNIRKMGALYLEAGAYVIAGVEAKALGIFEVSHDFFDEEYPIMTAGDRSYPYGFITEFAEDEKIIVRDSDGDSTNGVTMVLPKHFRRIMYMDLEWGNTFNIIKDFKDFYISFSNPNFTLNEATGEVIVTIPEGTRYMDCEMRLTFKYGKMAFSDYDIALTIPLYWTNLSTEELSEYYTASVRVGNAMDGYETVWSKRVLKNTEFELPGDEEVKKLIGYTANSLMYEGGAYAADYNTADGIIEDKVYDYNVNYKTYEITVEGIEGTDAPTQTFTARYGEAFDFTSLKNTGTNDPESGTYTLFRNVTTDAVITIGTDKYGNPVTEPVDLTSPLTARMVGALQAGMTATANYTDNSVTATLTFPNLDIEDIEQKLQKGGTVDITEAEHIAALQELELRDITPAIAPIRTNTVYVVTVGELTGDSYTITFDEQGGDEVADITKIGGAILGALSVPVKANYVFEGWYADESLTTPFESIFMPKENTTLFAKWKAEEHTVSFHINGGTSETPAPVTVSYAGTYGTLPIPERTNYGFIGWFTEAEGGVQITADTTVEITADQTLYAHWVKLVDIPREIFSFTKPTEKFMYNKDTDYYDKIQMDYNPEADAEYDLSEFTIEYMVEDGTWGYVERPKNAGTYLARISRPASGKYAKFEETYTGVITIDKASISLPDEGIQVALRGQSAGEHMSAAETFVLTHCIGYLDLEIVNLTEEQMAILRDSTKFQIGLAWDGDTYIRYKSTTGTFGEITTSRALDVWVSVKDDPNYETVNVHAFFMHEGTRYPSVVVRNPGTWEQKYEWSWRPLTYNNFNIKTAEQLAYVAYLVNMDPTYSNTRDFTITLQNDIDMYQYSWVPIGTSERPFQGTFEGNGHTITNLYVDHYSSSHYSGLFGICAGATIQNVNVTNSRVTGGYDMGSIAANIYGGSKVINCTFDGIVNGYERVGGIVGVLSGSSTIQNCSTSENTVIGGRKIVGGIAGNVSGRTITGCVNNAAVNGSSLTGGIVGKIKSDSDISDCINNGAIHANEHVGGIVGELNKKLTLTASVNNGSVSGEEYVDGLVGAIISGAICDISEDCKNFGDVTIN